MRVISVKSLREFWQTPGRQAAEGPLRAWFHEAKEAQWSTPAEIKAQYRAADFVGNGRVIFNIGGNEFRLIVAVAYATKEKGRLIKSGAVFIKFVGTHAEYDEIDAATIRFSG